MNVPEFLTCYDYGQGGIWLYIEAEHPSQITEIYRDLIVFETPPSWWTEEYELAARKHRSTDPQWREWLNQFKR